MLATSSSCIEGSSKRQVQNNVVFMGANNAKEIQSELWQVEILDRQRELGQNIIIIA